MVGWTGPGPNHARGDEYRIRSIPSLKNFWDFRRMIFIFYFFDFVNYCAQIPKTIDLNTDYKLWWREFESGKYTKALPAQMENLQVLRYIAEVWSLANGFRKVWR